MFITIVGVSGTAYTSTPRLVSSFANLLNEEDLPIGSGDKLIGWDEAVSGGYNYRHEVGEDDVLPEHGPPVKHTLKTRFGALA